VNAGIVRTFSEWANREPLDVRLTEADWLSVERLQAGGAPPVLVEHGRQSLQISTNSWVGSIPLQSLELRVIPKLIGGNLAVLTMLGYAHGQDAHKKVRKLIGQMSLPPEGLSLVDLIALLLAMECEQLIQQGLVQRFAEREETLAYVRGRLLVLDQFQKHFGQITSLECRYDAFDSDVTENRWLNAGLERALAFCRHDQVRQRLSACRAVFSEVCDASKFDITDTWNFEYQRDNEHYRDAHDWANLFLARRRLSRLFAAGPRSFAFMLDMNVVFEDFVARFISRALEPLGIRVASQRHNDSIIQWAETRMPYQTVIPDLLAMAPGGTELPIDAKYKLYGRDRKVDPGDVYQLFTYAFAYSDKGSSPIAVLIHPADTESFAQITLQIRSRDPSVPVAYIKVLGFPVARVLRALGGTSEDAILQETRGHLLQMWAAASVVEVR
jgi:5-methylcytosine-specific restriction enzyme subunit McrC